ncbi:MAG: hypothetical protein ACLVJ6_07345 [Merdibacter sp.]
MLKSRYRSYPVIDNNNYLKAICPLSHPDYHNKQVILVDHNEYAQSVKSVERRSAGDHRSPPHL